MSMAAAALRRNMDDPIYNKVLHKEVGRGELDYEVYVRTRELLALQTPADELVVPEELLFIVQHQTQELWLKCAVHECTNLVERLDGDRIFPALESLDRIVHIMQVLRDQIRVLGGLTPSQFQVIRRSLGNGSGLESPGYNHLLAASEAAEAALGRLIARRNTRLLDVYENPEEHADLHRLAERFVDWDGTFQAWLVEHFMLVRRTMGVDKTVRALDGFRPRRSSGGRRSRSSPSCGTCASR
ncbi:MAG: tryptophan 2,3-dioxygenase family protein [Thermoanaerobaculia bacterium]